MRQERQDRENQENEEQDLRPCPREACHSVEGEEGCNQSDHQKHDCDSQWHFSFYATKKTDVAEHPKVFGDVGLLTNEPLGTAGLLSI